MTAARDSTPPTAMASTPHRQAPPAPSQSASSQRVGGKTGAELSSIPDPLAGLPARVLVTNAIAHRFGFRNALALRRWARSRGVTLKRDGQKLWIAPGDIVRAVDALPSAEPVTPANDVEAAAVSAVASFVGKAR
jgi:hypothetical protein